MKLCIASLLCIAVLVQGRNVEQIQTQLIAKNDPFPGNNVRCNGINNGCCTDNNPCDVGDGDCDYDSHCLRDLVCGESNCKFPGGDDCCMEKEYKQPTALCFSGKWATGDGKGGSEEEIGTAKNRAHCVTECNKRRMVDLSINGCTFDTEDKSCFVEHNMYYVGGSSVYRTCYLPYIDVRGLRCQGADGGCCTENDPCDLHDGDCDNDDQCKGKLYCGNANCAWGYDDCCMQRHSSGDDKVEKLPEVVKEDNIIPEYKKDAKEDNILPEYKNDAEKENFFTEYKNDAEATME